MTPSELMRRVTRDLCVLGAALALASAWVGGSAGALGAAAGVALTLGNFRWLASRAVRVTATGTAARPLWSLGAGLRFAAVAAACAVLLATGRAHPVALVIGLSVLPCALIGHGLRTAREEPPA
jgi:ATP synthase I chain